MNVWMKVCRKQAVCNFCSAPITNGSYMVVCKYYRRAGKEGERQMWEQYLRFHPQCWIDQAVANLAKREVVETRGRKRLVMTDDIRAARQKVLVRRASVTQRIRAEVEKPGELQSIDRIIHLGELLNNLKEEIEPLGGVPKSWE